MDDDTSLEVILSQVTEAVNNAANDHVGLLSRIEPAISVSPGPCPVSGVTGLEASALAAVGCDIPVGLYGYDSRPAPLHELGRARGKQRDLANFLWVAYFNELFQAPGNRNRMLLAEGATAGSGLCLQGIPSVPHFRFSPRVMRLQVKALLGVSPAPFESWTHFCEGGKFWSCRVMGAATCTTVRSRAGPALGTAKS